MSLGTYTSGRVKGFAAWRPQAKARALVTAVEGVLDEYREHLPLTLRHALEDLLRVAVAEVGR